MDGRRPASLHGDGGDDLGARLRHMRSIGIHMLNLRSGCSDLVRAGRHLCPKASAGRNADGHDPVAMGRKGNGSWDWHSCRTRWNPSLHGKCAGNRAEGTLSPGSAEGAGPEHTGSDDQYRQHPAVPAEGHPVTSDLLPEGSSHVCRSPRSDFLGFVPRHSIPPAQLLTPEDSNGRWPDGGADLVLLPLLRNRGSVQFNPIPASLTPNSPIPVSAGSVPKNQSTTSRSAHVRAIRRPLDTTPWVHYPPTFSSPA